MHIVKSNRNIKVEKTLIKKNRYLKFVNNHKIPNHKFYLKKHIVSKESLYLQMSPIYQELDSEFCQIDLMDLEFYERWLNG